ncbi:hypothetical protein AAIR98_001621 [Elusimicrobium simillimum]|uniref:S1 family peptidase n=1 Tax=Elusimicrobium simillimum TaxID=3143438 RepID=UPI003C6FDC58
MKKLLASILFVLAAIPAAAQCQNAAFFDNTYAIQVKSDKHDKFGYSCHSVRLNKYWLLTSAHCVADRCKNKDCVVLVDMINTNPGARITVNHTKDAPRVFVDPDFVHKRFSAYGDLALVRINPDSDSFTYYERTENQEMRTDEFSLALRNERDVQVKWNKAMKYDKPVTILEFDRNNYEMTSTFSVADISTGTVVPSCAVAAKAYFRNTNGIGNIKGFAPGKGYSGGGVFDFGGHLIGIISGGSDDAYFPVFNAANTKFITDTMRGGLYKKDVGMGFGKIIPPDSAELL